MSPARGPYKRQPHPMEPQIRALLAEGLNNTRIAEQLNAPPKVVTRVRKETGTAPAPRSTYRRSPHPKTREINELLADGYSDAEIRRRTGADVRAVAALRAAGGYGKATIKPKPRTHPRDTEIRALLRGATRAPRRGHIQLHPPPTVARKPAVTEENLSWLRATPVAGDGGHMAWGRYLP